MFVRGVGTRSSAVMPPRYAVTLMAVIQAGFAIIGVANLIKASHTPQSLSISCVVVGCCYVLQLAHCSPQVRTRLRHIRWTLAAQAALSFAPVPLLGHESGAMCGFLAGACTVVLQPRLSHILFCLISLAVFVIALGTGDDLYTAAFMLLSCVSIGLISHALSRLVDLVTELHRRREESAWVAVSQERIRFTQDLHDLFSYSLSAITLKTELANRLIGRDDAQARKELSESLQITRAALADVRRVVHGKRSLHLLDEVERGNRVLHAANIEVSTEGDFRHIEPRIGSVLAVVLREAVTNILRHSQASRCRITLGTCSTGPGSGHQIELVVANNGAVGSPEPPGMTAEFDDRYGGNGLDHMAARVEKIGGVLQTDAADGWFVLKVCCPTQSPAALQVACPGPPTTFEHRSRSHQQGR
ncbi:sensor histidine kinase [Streptomyces sp. NPDC058295]|uniref:sensor histidine kinase n=1 Tax=Streptomyces sp. NPDC058295 TaxID=3346431 RepID=UPI0036E7DF73